MWGAARGGQRRGADGDDPPKALAFEDAIQYAVRALSARSLTEAELIRKLRTRNASQAVIEEVLERLRSLKFVDDGVIAARAAEDAALGRYGIQRKLTQRGVAKHLIEDALLTRNSDADLEAAQSLVERYNRQWTGERGYHKGMAFLMRRGFSGDVVRRALSDWAQSRQLEAIDEALED
jgi:regulatory protein